MVNATELLGKSMEVPVRVRSAVGVRVRMRVDGMPLWTPILEPSYLPAGYRRSSRKK